jgi:nucleotide-binding universal stress UspA family protein
MFSKAVVASDLSPASDRVVASVHGMRSIGTESIVLTHALGIRHLQELRHLLLPHVEPKLLEQQRVLQDHGFAVELVIATGVPAAEINRVAKEQHASLIVVGPHGGTLARRLFLGSVAVEVVHHAEVPVLIAKLGLTDGPAPRREPTCADFHRNVLYATDFSDTSERAFNYVEQIVRSGGRSVTLLHVQDAPQAGGPRDGKLDELDRIDRGRLERMERRLVEQGATEVRVELLSGFPKQAIARCAERGDYSLIVMGTQGRGYFGERLLGGVAYHVARHAVVPTLLVPPVR